MVTMSAPLAVIFDMDGTLTDTEVVWEQVRRGLAEHWGLPYPESATTDMMGMSTPEWAAYCRDRLGFPGTAQEIADDVINGVARAYAEGRVTLLPGAADAVRRMAERGPVAVASSSPPVLIDAGLTALGVGDVVSIRVSSEQVAAGKPAPDVYLETCVRLGIAPDRAVGVEDSRAGILAAAAAGLTVVAVPLEPHVPAPDVLGRAAVVLESLNQLTIPLVTSLFEAANH